MQNNQRNTTDPQGHREGIQNFDANVPQGEGGTSSFQGMPPPGSSWTPQGPRNSYPQQQQQVPYYPMRQQQQVPYYPQQQQVPWSPPQQEGPAWPTWGTHPGAPHQAQFVEAQPQWGSGNHPARFGGAHQWGTGMGNHPMAQQGPMPGGEQWGMGNHPTAHQMAHFGGEQQWRPGNEMDDGETVWVDDDEILDSACLVSAYANATRQVVPQPGNVPGHGEAHGMIDES